MRNSIPRLPSSPPQANQEATLASSLSTAKICGRITNEETLLHSQPAPRFVRTIEKHPFANSPSSTR